MRSLDNLKWHLSHVSTRTCHAIQSEVAAFPAGHLEQQATLAVLELRAVSMVPAIKEHLNQHNPVATVDVWLIMLVPDVGKGLQLKITLSEC